MKERAFPRFARENEKTPTHDVRPCTKAKPSLIQAPKSEAATHTPHPADWGGPHPGTLLLPLGIFTARPSPRPSKRVQTPVPTGHPPPSSHAAPWPCIICCSPSSCASPL